MKKRTSIFIGTALIAVLWTARGGNLAAFPGEVMRKIEIPTESPTGLATNGETVWYADRERDIILGLDLATGALVDSFPSPGYWPAGLAWDGRHLWCSDRASGKIARIDPLTRLVDRIVEAPGPSPVGLAWDGTSLWVSDDSRDEIVMMSPEDGTAVRSFAAPAGDVKGLAWDGKYLWASDRVKNEIYMIEPESGWILLILDAPGEYPWGLGWAGGRLLSLDMADDLLYEVVASDRVRTRTDQKRKAHVRIAHQARIEGAGSLERMDLYIALPRERANQKILGSPRFSPEPSGILEDAWGQRVAHFRYAHAPSPSLLEASIVLEAEIERIRFFIHPDSVKAGQKPPSEVAVYLSDGDKYRIHDEAITLAVRDAVGDEKNPYWIARKIYEYVIDSMSYELSGGWNTAPAVLSRGTGSCSEYSFVMIAMLRAAGIPARYVGSVVVRGDDVSFDDVFHRWVEFYLPGSGWVPADPSRGDKPDPRSRAASFGWIENSLLVTTEGGGGSEFLGWGYNTGESYAVLGKAQVYMETIADWHSRVEE